MTIRHALYFAPEPGTALERFGVSWLGRDAAGGPVPDRPQLPGWSAERLEALTSDPRRYGFHATLKAPFTLASGRSTAHLCQALTAFAERRHPFPLPPLEVTTIGRFLALCPSGRCGPLTQLADGTVSEFDAFRAPLSDAERRRRQAHRLSPRQQQLLERWGYPFVFDQFRFHLTLTNAVDDPAERQALADALAKLTGSAVQAPVVVASLCLFEEPVPGAPFRLVDRFRFGLS